MNEKILLTVYLTDDGCTDGTAEAIRESFHQRDIHILKGDGNMFWAGGMRYAWKTAMEDTVDWDFYLLLNDDTFLYDYCMKELFETHKYSLQTFQRAGMYSGIVCEVGKPEIINYGGWTKKGDNRPSDTPQMCYGANANILLVSKEVVEKIGILYKGYIHGAADSDYSHVARKNGFPVLTTCKICGECENDHEGFVNRRKKMLKMSLAERRAYFSNPKNLVKDYLTFIRRNRPLRYPIVWVGRWLNLYFPKFYYLIKNSY